MTLSQRLLADNAAIWRTWMPHPFTRAVAEATLAPKVFLRWLAQDYHFVREGQRFLAVLMSKAPPPLLDPLAETIHAWNRELELFRTAAEAAGADLQAPPLFITQAYADFLLAVAHQEQFATGWAVLFAVERSYHDAWRWARESAANEHPYRAWLDNWGSDEFRAFTDSLAERLDALEPALDEPTLAAVQRRFAQTARYEYHFWEMAWHGERFAVPR